MFGKTNILEELLDVYRLSVKRHNETVDKNRYVLNKVIDAVKLIGVHELPRVVGDLKLFCKKILKNKFSLSPTRYLCYEPPLVRMNSNRISNTFTYYLQTCTTLVLSEYSYYPMGQEALN